MALVEAYAKAQGLWRDDETPEPLFTDMLELDLGSVEPSLAGPKRPQDRVPLKGVKAGFAKDLPALASRRRRSDAKAPVAGTDDDARPTATSSSPPSPAAPTPPIPA